MIREPLADIMLTQCRLDLVWFAQGFAHAAHNLKFFLATLSMLRERSTAFRHTMVTFIIFHDDLTKSPVTFSSKAHKFSEEETVRPMLASLLLSNSCHRGASFIAGYDWAIMNLASIIFTITLMLFHCVSIALGYILNRFEGLVNDLE